MTEWQKWETLLKENPDKSTRELESIFNKSYSWIGRFKKFYNASTNEKEKLKTQNKQYTLFYKKWKYHLSRLFPVVIEKEKAKPAGETTSSPDEKEDINKIKFMLAELLIENQQVLENIRSLQEDNLSKAKHINQLVNKVEELEEKLNTCNLLQKVFKIVFYTTAGIIILLLVSIYFKI